MCFLECEEWWEGPKSCFCFRFWRLKSKNKTKQISNESEIWKPTINRHSINCWTTRLFKSKTKTDNNCKYLYFFIFGLLIISSQFVIVHIWLVIKKCLIPLVNNYGLILKDIFTSLNKHCLCLFFGEYNILYIFLLIF